MLKDSQCQKDTSLKVHLENNEGKKVYPQGTTPAISFAVFSTGVQQVQPVGHF